MAASQQKKKVLGLLKQCLLLLPIKNGNTQKSSINIFLRQPRPVLPLTVLIRWIFPRMWQNFYALPSIMNLKNTKTSIKHLKKRLGKKAFADCCLLPYDRSCRENSRERFGLFADLLEQKKLFVSDVKTSWMCLKCGHIYTGTEVREKCPVCGHDRGYFVRLELAPYTTLEKK